MNNSRPTCNIELPLKDGSTVSCTIKTPKYRIGNDVRELAVKAQMKVEEANGLYMQSNAINVRLAAALGLANRLKSSASSDADVQAALESATQIEAERDELVGAIVALNEESGEMLIEQAKLIVNIPNNNDATPRSVDDIDWEECEIDAIKDAIVFFLNGPQKSA